jgi:hypothetical protein
METKTCVRCRKTIFEGEFFWEVRMPDISQPLGVITDPPAVICSDCKNQNAIREASFRSAHREHGVVPHKAGILHCPQCDEYFIEQGIYPDEMN